MARIFISMFVGFSTLAFGSDEGLNGRYRILCESNNYQYHQCYIREGVQNAYLVQQHSSSPCTFNQSWGILRDAIWVDRGCRATFDVETYARRQTYDISCSSDNYQYRFCPAGGYVVDGFLLQQHSNSPCVQGRSWGFERDGIWVNEGCRATFRITVER